MSISRSIRVVLLSLTTLLLLWNCQIDMSPVARDDTAATDRNVPVTITVVTNDTAGTGHIVASTVAVVAGPEHGTAHAQADGTVIYTPATDFVGTDSFSYVVADITGETSNAATVTVTVRAVNRAPVANAGPDMNAVTGRPVTLDGAQSFDPDRDPLSFAWQFVAVPATSSVTTASLANAQTAAPSFTPDVDGTYGLELTVSDGTLSSTDQVQITAVSRPNVPPNANAGQDQTAQVGTVVLLDGRGSQDPDNGPQPLTFQWSFMVVPSGSTLTTADLQGATTPLANFTPDVVGVYRVSLQVSDGRDTSQAEVQITVMLPNVPPDADAGLPMVVQLGAAATLNGTASHDPDNGPQPLTYQWTLVSKPAASGLTNASIQNATTATPSFTPDVAGIYVLRLDVSDGALSNFAQVLVKANAAPVAVDDTFDAEQDQTLTVPAPGVLGNDTDGNNDPLTVVLGNTVSHGALTLNADGSFTYTPTTGFLGTDSFTYQANDGSVDSNMAAVTVTVTKPNGNQAPVVNAATFSVAENSANGTVVGTVTFTDPDAGQSHAFTITAGNPNNAFAIASTGQITVATSTALNFETTPGFSLTVQVTDNGTPAQSGSAVVTVNLSNVNELPVVNAATFTVLENSPNGTVVGAVTFTDPDVGQSGTFAITGGSGSGVFAINTSTGQLTVATSTALNFEMTPSFSLIVQVTDNGTPALAGSATITVNLTNVNEAPVVNAATFTVLENSPNGTVVGAVTFTDPDVGQSGTFAITGGSGSGVFAINTSTGQLTVATSTALNFEMTPSFSLIVQVTDNGTPALAGSATITVNLTNVNEAPVVNAATFTVLENSPNGTVVGAVTFTDPDVGQSGIFAITGGSGSGVFAINTSTGQLTVATSTALNFEMTPSFNLIVQVTDNGTPAQSGSATITVNLTNVNETPVVNAATFTVPENSANGTTVGTVTFSDPDAGTIGTFAITGGNTDSAFAINPTTGVITVATMAAVDFETTPTFTLTVQVTDNGAPPLSGSTTITINLTDVNEPPVAMAKNYSAQANMQIAIPAASGLLMGATDQDDAPAALSVATVSTTTPPGGTVTLGAEGAFDFDPPPGVTGDVTFTYTVCDDGVPSPPSPACSAPATVTFNVVGPVIWFVDGNAMSVGNGRLSQPFQTLAAADAVDAANHNIFLFAFAGTYTTGTTGLTLLAGEGLIGQGVSFVSDPSFTSFDAVFRINPPAGTIPRPSINGPRPTVQGTVTLATDSEVRGLNISTTSATGLSGGAVARVTVSEVSVTATSATAVNLNSTGGTVSLTSVSAGNTTAAPDPVNGILLTNTTGSFTVTGDVTSVLNDTGGTIMNTTGDGIRLTNVVHASVVHASFSRMNITNSGANGIFIETRDNAVATVIVTGSAFQNNVAAGIQGSALAQSNLTLKVLGVTNINTFTNNNEGVRCSNQNDADVTCEVSKNIFTGHPGNAIFVGNGMTLTSSASLNGKIENNDVTMPPDGNNHIILSSLNGTNSASGSSSAALLISGNTVIKDDGNEDFNFNGIHVNTTFNPATPNPNPIMGPSFRVTVTSNNVKNTANGLSAISLNALGSSSPCFNVLSNTTKAPGGSGVLVGDFTSGIVRLERGTSLSDTALDVLKKNNTDLGSSVAASVEGNVRVVENGFCATFTPP